VSILAYPSDVLQETQMKIIKINMTGKIHSYLNSLYFPNASFVILFTALAFMSVY